jgi:hypothetical protein
MMKFELYFGNHRRESSFKKLTKFICIFRFQYRRIQQKDINDERLPIMCIALWKKMKYAVKKNKKLN